MKFIDLRNKKMNLSEGVDKLWDIGDNFTYLARQNWVDHKGIHLINFCTEFCAKSLNDNNTIDFEDAVANDYVLKKWELPKLKEVNPPVLLGN